MNLSLNALREQYGCGPVQFSGTEDALYDRHLIFDRVIDPKRADSHEQWEAAAHALRDVISQRWLKTDATYELKNPKRVYYMSMEFLLGRSLANNVTNALLTPIMLEALRLKRVDWPKLTEAEPDAGLGNGGLGRLAACFIDSMATLQIPGIGYGLRYEYGIFKQTFKDGWQHEQPDNWLRWPDPWEVARPQEAVEVKLNCSFELQAGELKPVFGRPSNLLGIPYDRPVIGYGGKTINTLRLWAAGTPDYFDFQQFSRGEFVGALTETLAAESLTRVLYPDDSTSMGQGLRFLQEYFLVACSIADLVRRFRLTNRDWQRLAAEGRDSDERHASGHGSAGADARAARRRALGMGRGLGSHAASTGLHESHAAPGGAREVAAPMVRAGHPPQLGDHSRDQPAPARRRARSFSRRPGSRCAHELHRGERRSQGPHG